MSKPTPLAAGWREKLLGTETRRGPAVPQIMRLPYLLEGKQLSWWDQQQTVRCKSGHLGSLNGSPRQGKLICATPLMKGGRLIPGGFHKIRTNSNRGISTFPASSLSLVSLCLPLQKHQIYSVSSPCLTNAPCSQATKTWLRLKKKKIIAILWNPQNSPQNAKSPL